MRFERENITFPPEADISWERETRAVMSDRSILKKHDVKFKPTPFNPAGYKHSYGWTISAKLKAGADLVKLQAYYEARGFERQC
jgi:hypothetical protein